MLHIIFEQYSANAFFNLMLCFFLTELIIITVDLIEVIVLEVVVEFLK